MNFYLGESADINKHHDFMKYILGGEVISEYAQFIWVDRKSVV